MLLHFGQIRILELFHAFYQISLVAPNRRGIPSRKDSYPFREKISTF